MKIGTQKTAIFSMLDQKSGYFSLKLHPNSYKYTAFSTQKFHYEYTRLPQGYRNSPSVYMSALSRLLMSELSDSAILYLDDLILFSSHFDVHIKLLETVFYKFCTANLKKNAAKCRLAATSLRYLGQRFTLQGMQIDQDRFEAL